MARSVCDKRGSALHDSYLHVAKPESPVCCLVPFLPAMTGTMLVSRSEPSLTLPYLIGPGVGFGVDTGAAGEDGVAVVVGLPGSCFP